MDATTTVTRERRGDILLIGLNRAAKRNAFDMAMLDELALAYGEMERDDAREGMQTFIERRAARFTGR